MMGWMVAHLTSVRIIVRLAHRTKKITYPCADDFEFRIEGDKVRAISRRDPSKFGIKVQKCCGCPRETMIRTSARGISRSAMALRTASIMVR